MHKEYGQQKIMEISTVHSLYRANRRQKPTRGWKNMQFWSNERGQPLSSTVHLLKFWGLFYGVNQHTHEKCELLQPVKFPTIQYHLSSSGRAEHFDLSRHLKMEWRGDTSPGVVTSFSQHHAYHYRCTSQCYVYRQITTYCQGFSFSGRSFPPNRYTIQIEGSSMLGVGMWVSLACSYLCPPPKILNPDPIGPTTSRQFEFHQFVLWTHLTM